MAAVVLYGSSMLLAPGTRTTRILAGISLQMFVALHIYQLHGLPEMHFFFFTAQTMLIIYEDWLVTWPGTFLIIGQHSLFAVLQNRGLVSGFFPDSYIPLSKMALHYGIALVQTALCTYWTILQRHRRLEAEMHKLQIESSRDEVAAALAGSQKAERALELQAVKLTESERLQAANYA